MIVDDTTSVADRDTLASTVPTSVDEVSLSAALLHLLHELLSILCGVQLQECLAEASRESRSRLSDTTLCTSQLSSETREELNVVDRIAYAGILSNALVSEVDLAVSVNSNVLQQGVAADSVVDVGLALLVEVDNLSVATTLEVEYALVVPSVLVVTNQQTLRIG